MAFKYQKRSAEQMEKRKKPASDFVGIFVDGTKTYAVKETSENALRILPPNWEGAEHYGIDVHIHYGLGPDNQAALCLQKHKGKPCPACEVRAKLMARGDEDEAKAIRANRAVVMYVVDRDNEKEGVLAWRCPITVDADIVKVSIDGRSGETFAIDDPDEGFDVYFDVEGTKQQRKYKGVKLARKSSRLAKKHIDYIEEHPLPEVLNYLTYKEMDALLAGVGSKKSRDDDDEDEDDRPKRKSARSRDEEDEDERPAKKSRARDEEDEEEDERPVKKKSRARDEEEEEEEEKPKTKRRRPADDDEDEEEEKPAKSKRRRPADDDDEEEEEPKPKAKRRPADDDDDEEEEEVKKAPFDKGKKVKRAADDDEDEEEDEKPRSQVRERLEARKRR